MHGYWLDCTFAALHHFTSAHFLALFHSLILDVKMLTCYCIYSMHSFIEYKHIILICFLCKIYSGTLVMLIQFVPSLACFPIGNLTMVFMYICVSAISKSEGLQLVF
jgi:hypothetical protein